MPRRGENIRKRKDGRWEARYIKGHREDGKAIYGYLYGKSYAEAKEKKSQALSGLYSVTVAHPNRAVFDTVIDQWLAYQRYAVKESTYLHYRRQINTHIRPELGMAKVSQMTQDTLVKYVDHKLTGGRLDGKGGLAVKTVRDLVVILRQILTFAAEQGYMSLLSVKSPKKKNVEIQILDKWEQERLERYVLDHSDTCRFGVYLCLYTGLRIGELCALRWGDIQFENCLLSVRRTIQRVDELNPQAAHKTKVIIDTPKTAASIRDIPLPSFLAELLWQYGQNVLPSDYVLTGSSRYIEPRSYYNKYKKFLKECGIGDHTFHALRHTFATRCIEQGFDPKSLSEILGHTDVTITLQRYVHSSLELKRAHMERLANTSHSGSSDQSQMAFPSAV